MADPASWAQEALPPAVGGVLILSSPFLGSFLALVAQRWAQERPFLWTRSACESCGRVLGPLELVPLVSYLLLRARCRGCKAPIPWSLAATEAVALGLALWAAAVLGPGVTGGVAAATAVLAVVLVLLALIDARTFLLPDALTLPLILAGLGVTAWLDPAALRAHALAAVFGYGVIWLIAETYRRLRGRDGLGLGDAKLLAAAGAWLGPLALPSVLFIGAASGLVAAGLARAGGQAITLTSALPFGPFLAFGIWVTWLHGPLRF
ncbi:MAG: prepilin peptidase [Alphaproteobacteria bacterium]